MAPQILLGLLETVGMLSFKRILRMLNTKRKQLPLGTKSCAERLTGL